MSSSRSKPPPQQHPTKQLPRAKQDSKAPKPRQTMEVDTSWLESEKLTPPPLPRPAPAEYQHRPTVREMPARRKAQNLPTQAEMPATTLRKGIDSDDADDDGGPIVPDAGDAPKAAPPRLSLNAGRHNTMEVDTRWLESNDVDRKLRTSLAPLPPPESVRPKKVTGLSREEPEDDSPSAKRPSARPSRQPAAKKSVQVKAVKKKTR